jgi:uncharacterized protein YcsI (UPF0317 family)
MAQDALAIERSETNPARQTRLSIRAGEITGHTGGVAPGYVQGNLCILPADYAEEFASYCQRNPKPCPLLASSAPGDPTLPTLAPDLDIRTDVPRYKVFRDGELVDEPTEISDLWRDDLVSFVLGCSFSFEQALIEDGVRLHHLETGASVAMYLSNIDTVPAGRFNGKMVVSMRPFSPADAIRAVQITTRFPSVHGAPVHIGLPELIGIEDLERPYDGPAPNMPADEIPVFWACGVTPQVAVAEARPPLCITHYPGSMVVTDLLNARLAIF